MLRQPPFLNQGDTVAIVAPAKAVDQDKIAAGIEILKSWGLYVKEGKTLSTHFHQFAGTDTDRRLDLQENLDNPDIKAIFCARGGYGTSRIIDEIDFSIFRKSPKWIIGFSDITVLLGNLLKEGFQCIHGPMPATFPTSVNTPSLEMLRRMLYGEVVSIAAPSHSLNRQGVMEGEVTGGNLSIVVSMTGTSSDLDAKGKILFLEDVGEYLYRIDRMMIHLKRSGKLRDLKGLIVGQFTDMCDNDTPFGKDALEIIADTVAEYDYPLCFDFPAGHCPNNMPLMFGKTGKVSVQEKGAFLDYSR